MPPPIRYPLPTLVALLLLGLLAWRGSEWMHSAAAAISSRWHRVVEGPPVPASTVPMVIAGPIIRRGLILRDETPVSDRPDSKPTDTISHRMFVDIYDVWPTKGPVTHLRVGNRSPIGWVPAADCLEWSTRLVIRAPHGRLGLARTPDGPTEIVETGPFPLAVTDWRKGRAEVVLWYTKRPWGAVSGRGWVDLESLPGSAIGVLLSQVELPALIPLTLAADDPQSRDRVRLQAVLGRLVENVSWTAADVETARKALPALIFARSTDANPSERIAALNASSAIDAAWSGLAFRFVPLTELP